jgi:hypothetical protein
MCCCITLYSLDPLSGEYIILHSVIFECNTCYSISYSVNNICINSISLSFSQMVNLVIVIFESNTCYSISYSVNFFLIIVYLSHSI